VINGISLRLDNYQTEQSSYILAWGLPSDQETLFSLHFRCLSQRQQERNVVLLRLRSLHTIGLRPETRDQSKDATTQ
jgi:hypothetical protein